MKSANGIWGGEKGFTLLELMVVVLISGIMVTAIFSIYTSQQKAAEHVENMSAMQQNLRSAFFIMEREVRMAGCNPTLAVMTNNGIVTANAASIRFQSDASGDGVIDADEDIAYALNGTDLERNGVTVAENVLALDFVYLDDDGTVLNPAGANVATGQYGNIQTVQLSILVQAPRSESNFVNVFNYENLQGRELLAAQNDQIPRLLSVSSIRMRNM